MQAVLCKYLTLVNQNSYTNAMNPIQRQILELADTIDLGSISYYRLSKKLGVNHPYKVKFALDQLEKNGQIIRNRQTGKITKLNKPDEFAGLLNIPYYGEVNCGVALSIADDAIRGFLRVSPSVIKRANLSKIFALKASGNSMNTANIDGKAVEDGDYILVERIERGEAKSGDYIVSIIQGAANLKRLAVDSINQQIVLVSESIYDYPPIIISTLDADDDSAYIPIARAVEVIKSAY